MFNPDKPSLDDEDVRPLEAPDKGSLSGAASAEPGHRSTHTTKLPKPTIEPGHRLSPQPEVSPPTYYVGPLQSILKEMAYNPEKQRDKVRAATNFCFIGIFALTIIAALYVVVWNGPSWSQTKELLDLLLPAETALIGSAVGFYFGSKAAQSDHS